MSGRLRGTPEQQEWVNDKLLHRQFLSQPPGQRGLFLSLPHSTTQLAYRLLCTCSLWLRDCPDRAGGTSSACTDVIENGEEHSMNCSWVLETILKNHFTVVATKLAGIQTALKTNGYLKSTLNKEVLMLCHIKVYLYFWSAAKGSFKRKGRCQCFPYEDRSKSPKGESMNMCDAFAKAEKTGGSIFYYQPSLRSIMAENYLVINLTAWLLNFTCNKDIQAKCTISGGLQGWKSLGYLYHPFALAVWKWCWTLPTFLYFPNRLGGKKNKTKNENQNKNVWCPCSPKCWTCLSEMLCQQLFTRKPIIFIGHGSQAGVDRLIYSNSESHLYSLYPKAQPAPYLNATFSRTGMLERERERALEPRAGAQGVVQKNALLVK